MFTVVNSQRTKRCGKMIPMNDIRRDIADRTFEIRDIMLTAQQSEVLRFVRKDGESVRSSAVAKRFNLSAQHSCMVMDKLYRKGYVDRKSQPQESGGYEYEYISAID